MLDISPISLEIERWLMLRYAIADRPRTNYVDLATNKSWRRCLESHNKGFTMAVALNMFIHYSTIAPTKRNWSVLRPNRE